jgi:AraC-like DNA-binding protein
VGSVYELSAQLLPVEMTMTSLTEHAVDLVAQSGDPEVPFGSWTDAVRQSVLSFQFDCDRPRAFAGMISNRSLGGVSFINMACGKHAAYRDQSSISDSDAGFYVMTLQLSGELRMAQDDRAAVLKAGLFAIYDSSKPAALTASDNYKSTCIRFPKEYLGSRSADPLAGITATAFEYAPGLPSSVWDMLISLNRNLEALGTYGRPAVRSVMGMVTTLLRNELGGDVAPRQGLLLQQIKDYVEEHLGEPELDPASIAAAHYISPRHLHNLFEHAECTVSRWIRMRRIERCRRDLADPSTAQVPVSAIGARWGFNGPSHFCQVFKKDTGRTPAEFRQQAMSELTRP